MQRLITVAIILALAFYAMRMYGEHRDAAVRKPADPPAGFVTVADDPAPVSRFRCDGRTHCSQMTSCDEATYFLRNCPGVKMDGEGDGVPCESQWCGRR